MHAPSRAPRRLTRARRLVAAVALLTVGALFAFDCLNLLQSDSWADLSRAPHLAAVSQGKAEPEVSPADHAPSRAAAVVPAALTLLVVWLLWAIAGGLTTVRLAPGVRRRPTGRGPPARAATLPARA